MKYFMRAKVLAVHCKLHFDSHSHSLIPTGRGLHPRHEISLKWLLYGY